MRTEKAGKGKKGLQLSTKVKQMSLVKSSISPQTEICLRRELIKHEIGPESEMCFVCILRPEVDEVDEVGATSCTIVLPPLLVARVK